MRRYTEADERLYATLLAEHGWARAA
jgi:hypothetical protein